MTPADDPTALATAPKALLHDHLDGGLRPATILELADECGWTPNLPATDPAELQAWFTRGAETGDILQYLRTFEHTLAVLQTAEALERVAAEAVTDLAADGVVYAEIRFAPELHDAVGPEGGDRCGVRRSPAGRDRGRRDDLGPRHLLRDAHRHAVARDRRARRSDARRRAQGGRL